MSDVLIRIVVAAYRSVGARTRLFAKPAREANNTQSAKRVGLAPAFGKLRLRFSRRTIKMDASEITALIEAGMPDAVVTVQSPDNNTDQNI